MARHKSANLLLMAALSVSLGAAICATLFVLLLISTPLPYPQPQRLFVAQLERPEGGEAVQFSYPAIELLKREAHEVLEPVVVIDHARDLLLSHPAQPLVRVTYASSGYAELFAPAMAHGRFLRGEPEDAPVAVISHAAWLSLFEQRADVIGLNLQTAVGTFEIIGVTAADFAEPELHGPGYRTAVWLPWSQNPTPRLWGWSAGTDRLSFVGRLLPGLNSELAGNRLSHRLGQAWIEAVGSSAHASPATVPRVVLGSAGQAIAGSGLDLAPWLLIGALGLIAITFANIAHVMVARVAERGRELSIQRALGANSARLYAQVLIDALGLILPAGLLSLLVVAAGIAAMQHHLAGMLPRLEELSLDWRAVLFGLGGAGMLAWALASIAFLGCLQYTQASPQTLGRSETRRVPRRLRGLLMSAQIGLAGVLIAASFALLREAAQVLGEQGLDLERSASLFLYQSGTATPGTSTAQLFDEVRRALSELPNVEHVSQSHSPLQDFIRTTVISNSSGLQSPVGLKRIDAEYLGMTGQKLAQGRNFHSADIQQEATVALVNASLARALDRDGAVLGTVLTREGGAAYEVVGVVDDLRYPGGSTADWHLYLPASTAGSSFLLRFRPGEAVRREEIVAHVAAINAGLGVFLFDDLSQQRSQILLPRKLAAAGTSIIALAVMLAAGLGLHGMIEHATRQMRGEIGTRLAFGARPLHVLMAVAKQHAWAFAFGAALSMAAALLLVALLPALGALSFSLHWIDLGAAWALLAVLAGLACVLSARPLLSQAPAGVLRGE